MPKDLSHWGMIFHVTEDHEDIVDAVLTKGRSLTGSDRLLFESVDYQISGNSILQRHENLSPDGVPESLRLDNLILRFPDTPKDKLLVYKNLILETELTYPAAVRLLNRAVRHHGIDATLSWLEKVADSLALDMSADRDVLDVQRDQLEQELGTPTYSYHKVGDMFEPEHYEPEWFDTQPHHVQRLLTTPKRCTSLDQLKLLGKRCYEAESQQPGNLTDYQQVYLSMSNSQRAVFWSMYQSRKHELTPYRPLTGTAQALLNRIESSAEQDFRKLKGTLYKIQHGQIRVRDPPADYEWSGLWRKYRQREHALQNPPQEKAIPEGYSRCGYCYVSGGEMYQQKLDTTLPAVKYDPSQNILHCLSCQYF